MGKILPFFHPYFSKWVETTSFVIDEMFSSVPPWEFSLLKNGGKKMDIPWKSLKNNIWGLDAASCTLGKV